MSKNKMRKLISFRMTLVNKIQEMVDKIGPEVVESFSTNRIIVRKLL